jgi:hypothetical protein
MSDPKELLTAYAAERGAGGWTKGEVAPKMRVAIQAVLDEIGDEGDDLHLGEPCTGTAEEYGPYGTEYVDTPCVGCTREQFADQIRSVIIMVLEKDQ